MTGPLTQSQSIATMVAPLSPGFVKESLTPWTKVSFNVDDSLFVKLYIQEEKPMEDKYDLISENWEGFKYILIDKLVRCCLNVILTSENNDLKDCNILTEFLLLNANNVEDAQDSIWTNMSMSNTQQYIHHDNQIKFQILRTYLLKLLTVASWKFIDLTKDKFNIIRNGETFRHSPTIF